jgi:hypothetical protein
MACFSLGGGSLLKNYFKGRERKNGSFGEVAEFYTICPHILTRLMLNTMDVTKTTQNIYNFLRGF